MIRPGAEAPWWLQDAPPDDPAPQLLGDVDAASRSSGAGSPGSGQRWGSRSASRLPRLRCWRPDLCGLGPSGRNGGFLHGYWSSLAGLRDLVGDEAALALAHAGDRVVPRFDHSASAAARTSGFARMGCSRCRRRRSRTRRSSTRSPQPASSAGNARPCRCRGAELSMRCRSPRFRRGVLFRDGATVQPARLVRALRREAIRQGVRVTSGARDPASAGRPTVLETPGGSVRADEVVVAVDAAAAGWRPTARRLTVCAPTWCSPSRCPICSRRIGWTGGEGMYDARMFLHYFRTTRDGRVLIGSGSGPIGHGGRLDGGLSRRAVDRQGRGRPAALLPGLARARVEHAWGGRSTSRPITCPSSARFRARGSTTRPATPETASGRAGSRRRRSRRSRPGAARTSGRVCRSSRGGCRASRPEPLKRLGGGACGRRSRLRRGRGRGPPAVPRRAAGAALPRLFRLRVGTR